MRLRPAVLALVMALGSAGWLGCNAGGARGHGDDVSDAQAMEGDTSTCACPPQQCADAVCDPETGQCIETPKPAQTFCDRDNDPCTIDRCDEAGVCRLIASDTNNPGCLGLACRTLEDCDDADPCTVEWCDPGAGCSSITAEERCSGGTDEDCDGQIDCDDRDCHAVPPCGERCGAVIAAGCGELIAASGTASHLASYGCGGAALPGAEVVYAFTAAAGGTVRWEIEAAPAGFLHMLVLAGSCQAAECTAEAKVDGASGVVEIEAESGVTYHLVVDSAAGGLVEVAGGALTCATAETCSNGADDDLDGLADCADSDCVGAGGCGSETVCGDAADNDADGATDCADVDCHWVAPCEPLETSCTDGFDNDGDDRVDCEDDDCAAAPECGFFEQDCGDGADDDGDGAVDCADPDCAGSSACAGAEVACGDSKDNDGDGLSDCADGDCVSWPPCSGSCAFKAAAMMCGGSKGALHSFQSMFSEYPCAGGGFGGAEVVIRIEPAISTTVTLTGDAHGPATVLLLAGECVPDGCLSHWSVPESGVVDVTFPAASGTTYYLVIEGPADQDFIFVEPAAVSCGAL